MPEGGGVGLDAEGNPLALQPGADSQLEGFPPLPPPSDNVPPPLALGGASPAPTKHAVTKGSLSSDDGADQKKVIDQMVAAEGNSDFKRMLKVAARSGSEVPRESIMKYLDQEIDQNQKCLEFPFILVYFFLFAGMVLLHEHIVDVSQVERNFNGFLSGTSFEGIVVNPKYPVGGHKTLEDIDLVADVWTYLHDAVLPLFLNPNSSTADNDMDRVLRYNQLIGGLTLKQVRMQRRLCDEEYPDLGPKNARGFNPFLKNFVCFPHGSIDSQAYGPGLIPGNRIQGFTPESLGSTYQMPGGGRRLLSAKHAARARLGFGTSGSEKTNPFDKEMWDNLFVSNMWSFEGLEVGLTKLKELQANTWIDEQTAVLEISMFSLNPDLGVYTQSLASLYFVQDGSIIPFVRTCSFLSRPYSHAGVFIFDCFWAIMWLQMSATFIYRVAKVYGCKAAMKDLFMWIDGLCVAGGFIMIVFWIIYVVTLGELQDAVATVAVNAPERFPSMRVDPIKDTLKTYSASVKELQGKVAEMVQFIDVYRVGITWYCLLCVVRFFKAFRAQPRLAVVTNTLIGCAVDFIHFFIVFWTMFMSYVLAAMFLFGHRLADFSNTEMAVTKCFLLLLGDFDFDELMEENPVTAALWFYTFMIFMMLLLLNMSLAIIMDVYSDAKGCAALSDAIWEQLGYMWMELRAESYGIVKSKDIMTVLTAMDIEYVGKHSLMEAIPTMSEDQAQALITKVEVLEQFDDEQSLTMADALKLIISTKSGVATIDKQLTGYMNKQKENRGALNTTKGSKAGAGSAGQMELHPESDKRIRLVEQRLEIIENVLNEAMAYMVFRGKELRNRLKGLEDKLRFQRDAATASNTDLWANNPSILRGRSASPPPPQKLTDVAAPGRPVPTSFSA